MGEVASQITSPTIVYATDYSGTDQRKHQSSASLAFVPGIHRWPVNSPHKGHWRGKCFHLMTSSWTHNCLSTKPLWLILWVWFRAWVYGKRKIRYTELFQYTAFSFYTRNLCEKTKHLASYICAIFILNDNGLNFNYELQWNLSVTTTSMIKFITLYLFSNVF